MTIQLKRAMRARWKLLLITILTACTTACECEDSTDYDIQANPERKLSAIEEMQREEKRLREAARQRQVLTELLQKERAEQEVLHQERLLSLESLKRERAEQEALHQERLQNLKREEVLHKERVRILKSIKRERADEEALFTELREKISRRQELHSFLLNLPSHMNSLIKAYIPDDFKPPLDPKQFRRWTNDDVVRWVRGLGTGAVYQRVADNLKRMGLDGVRFQQLMYIKYVKKSFTDHDGRVHTEWKEMGFYSNEIIEFRNIENLVFNWDPSLNK